MASVRGFLRKAGLVAILSLPPITSGACDTLEGQAGGGALMSTLGKALQLQSSEKLDRTLGAFLESYGNIQQEIAKAKAGASRSNITVNVGSASGANKKYNKAKESPSGENLLSYKKISEELTREYFRLTREELREGGNAEVIPLMKSAMDRYYNYKERKFSYEFPLPSNKEELYEIMNISFLAGYFFPFRISSILGSKCRGLEIEEDKVYAYPKEGYYLKDTGRGFRFEKSNAELKVFRWVDTNENNQVDFGVDELAETSKINVGDRFVIGIESKAPIPSRFGRLPEYELIGPSGERLASDIVSHRRWMTSLDNENMYICILNERRSKKPGIYTIKARLWGRELSKKLSLQIQNKGKN